MKANRIVREDQIDYVERTYGPVTHVIAKHRPSGLSAKVTEATNRLHARYQAREALQVKLNDHWLP